MHYLIAVIAALTIATFGSGCGSDSDPTGPTAMTIDADQEQIIGQWEWDYSFGGIAGMQIDPESTGQTRKLIFDGQQLQQFVNDSLRQSNSYDLAMDQTIFDLDSVPVVRLDGVTTFTYTFEDANLLILNDNFVDGFAHHYRRD
jgi:hypothetical protein